MPYCVCNVDINNTNWLIILLKITALLKQVKSWCYIMASYLCYLHVLQKKKHYFLVLFFLAISLKYFDYNTFWRTKAKIAWWYTANVFSWHLFYTCQSWISYMHFILTNILLKTSCLTFGSLDVIYRTIRLIMSTMRDEFTRKVILIST